MRTTRALHLLAAAAVALALVSHGASAEVDPSKTPANGTGPVAPEPGRTDAMIAQASKEQAGTPCSVRPGSSGTAPALAGSQTGVPPEQGSLAGESMLQARGSAAPFPPVVFGSGAAAETWKGSVFERTKLIVTTDQDCPYAVDFSGRDAFDLQVAADGSVTGTVTGTLLTADICDRPGWITFSRINQPISIARVEGKRDTDGNGQLRMRFTNWTALQAAQIDVSSCIDGAPYVCHGFGFANFIAIPNSLVDPRYATLLGAPGELGRPARLSPSPAVITNTSIPSLRFIYTRQGNLLGQSAGQPRLSLTSEMAQPEIYLRGVTVPEPIRYTATTVWDLPGGGSVVWSLGDTFRRDPPAGTTTQTSFTYDVDAGSLQAPATRLTAQAVNALGTASVPGVINLVTVPPPDWSGGPSAIRAEKRLARVLYRWDRKLPETPFEARSATLPAGLPFFGGGDMGYDTVTVPSHAMVLSTGMGGIAGNATSAFHAMNGSAACQAEVLGTLVLDPDGAHLKEGEVEAVVDGSITGYAAVGAVAPSISNLVGFGSLAFYGPVPLTLAQKWKPPLRLRDENGLVDLVPGESGVPLEIKQESTVAQGVVLNLIGEVVLHLQTRPPQMKNVDGSFMAVATLTKGPSVYTTGDHWWVQAGPSGASSQVVHAQEAGPATWSLADRSYLDASDYARWTAPAVRAESVAAGEVDTQLVENVQPQARPALASSASQRLLLWSHETPGAPALSAQELAYSRSCNGCAPDWQPWQLATDESGGQARADLAPHVAFLDGATALAVWERFDTAAPPDFGSDPVGYLSHSQVAAARWDSSAWNAPHQLSVSGSLNDRPQVAAIDGGALAVWVGNASNQMSGDAGHPDRLLFARYDAGADTWTAAAALTSNPVSGSGPDLSGVAGCSLAANGSHAAVVFSLDTDGNPATPNDRELYVVQWQANAWTAPQRLTNDAVSDTGPLLALAADGSPLLVWRQGSALGFLRDAWTATATALDLPQALAGSNRSLARHPDGHLALVWEQNVGSVGHIGYAIYDASLEAWSDAREVSAPAPPVGQLATVRNSAPAFGRSYGQDTLLVGYQLVSSELVTRIIDGTTVPNVPEERRHDLRLLELPLETNLSIAPTSLELSSLGPTLSGVVHNTGVWGVGDVPVRLRIIRWSAQPGTPPTEVARLFQNVTIAAGQAAEVAFPLPLAVTPDLLLYVTVDPDQTLAESDRADNTATFHARLALTPLPNEVHPLGVTVQAEVRQVGPYIGMSTPLRLHRDAPSGAVVAETSADFPLTPTDAVTAAASIDSSVLGPGLHLLYWEGGPQDAVSAAVPVLPDLMTAPELIGFGRGPGPTADVVVRVENRGNWASPATSLRVLDGSPGGACTHVLLTLPVPALQPGDGADLRGTLSLSGTSAAGTGLKLVYVQVDPDGAVEELDDTNNLTVAGTLPTAADPGGCPPARRPRRRIPPH